MSSNELPTQRLMAFKSQDHRKNKADWWSGFCFHFELIFENFPRFTLQSPFCHELLKSLEKVSGLVIKTIKSQKQNVFNISLFMSFFPDHLIQ